MAEKPIGSVSRFVEAVQADYDAWGTRAFPWFRGEPESDTPLLPSLFRTTTKDGQSHDELLMLQLFRERAPVPGSGFVPPRDGHTDQWLFLAQHVGLPTRLLDWTEGSLIALCFALHAASDDKSPVVWMLNPMELNNLSLGSEATCKPNEYGLTWVEAEGNVANENFQRAWLKRDRRRGTESPVAIQPTSIHPRMSAQRSCFTIHGKREEPLSDLIAPRHLKRYAIESSQRSGMLQDLRMLGISHASVFPDLDGLARDLATSF
jgi:hypothetical protein